MSARQPDYEDLPDTELPPEVDAMAQAMIEEADRETPEVQVNFRWGRHQLDIVKRAAALVGVPYEAYVKMVLFRQAVADLRGPRA